MLLVTKKEILTLKTLTFTETGMLGPEPVELGGIPINLVWTPNTSKAEGASTGVPSVSVTSLVLRITIASNRHNKSLDSSDRFLEFMRMQMIHEVWQRFFDKEDAKEKRKAEDRARMERKEKKDNDRRSNFEMMFLTAIGGGMNMIKSGKRVEMCNNKDSGSWKRKVSEQATIHLSSDINEVGSSDDSSSDDEYEASDSAMFNLE